MLKDKIRGMFLGVGIGDALGMPFECKSFEDLQKVKKKSSYSKGRQKAGTWTDDMQLTIATATAILEAGCFDMDKIAAHHVMAYDDSISGWGSTTREAVKKISTGTHWSKAGDFEGATNRGLGNGVVMKAAPLAAYFALTNQLDTFVQSCVDFATMTHQTSVAVSSCLAHVMALYECLTKEDCKFDTKEFIKKVSRTSEIGRSYFPNTLTDDLTDRFNTLLNLYENPKLLYDDKHLVEQYGQGSCYVYNSQPFSYAFFIRSPFQCHGMIDVTYAGGDTDTNASIVGSLIGALRGEDVFPSYLKDKLDQKDGIIALADAFYDKFLPK
jgi:ADP-ribosyl-[dinitrogen reductase] hydrolase